MGVTITEHGIEIVAEYASIETHFTVNERLRIVEGEHGFELNSVPIEPWTKNYDYFCCDRPAMWKRRFDTSNWKIFLSRDAGQRTGGAVVAWKTPNLDMLGGRSDTACLWGIRIAPAHRGRGMGHRLFSAVEEWARNHEVRRLVVETQDINVPACRFYAAQGCSLIAVNPEAYPPDIDEVQLIWEKQLR